MKITNLKVEKLSFEQLIAILDEISDNINVYIPNLLNNIDEYDEYLDNIKISFPELYNKIGNYVEIEFDYINQNIDETSQVFHFTDHNIFIRFDGFYDVYKGGSIYDDPGYEVFPKEKIIIVYEK